MDGRHVYLVPRADGEIVVGATQEERTDAAVTAGAVHDLLRAAIDLVPALAELELAETAWGTGRARRTTRRCSAGSTAG